MMAISPFFRFPYNNYYRYYNPYINNPLNYRNHNINNDYMEPNKNAKYNNENQNKQKEIISKDVKNDNNKSNTNSERNHNNKSINNSERNHHSKTVQAENNSNSNSNLNLFGLINVKNPLFSDLNEPVLEVLGMSFYLDDLIILGLLFFLYIEGVQDEMLYISLLLLLLG